MKKSFFKVISLLLAVFMLAAAFAACASDPSDSVDSTAAAVPDNSTEKQEETTSNYDENGYLKDSIPASLKLNTTIRMLYWNDVENPEFFVEESNGDLVNDAIFNRNARVEGRLNVEFDFVGTVGNYNNNSAYLTFVRNAANANDVYDIYAAYSMTTANIAYNGFTRNLHEYEVIDFSKPWWREGLTTEATFNNKLYFASGDLSTNLLYMMYTFYFNKDLLEVYKLDNPYDLVDSNNWTFEKMFEMSEAIGLPQNAESNYAFVTTSDVHLDPFFWAAGLRVIDKEDDGTLFISDSFAGERAVEVASATQTFLNKGYNIFKDSDKHFANGTALFALDRARFASKNLADISFTFGVVPMPKYDADQANYVTCLGYPYTLYAISTSSTQPEAVATVLECLSSEGYRLITPALFELTMKFRYTSDSQAGRMFDIIRSTVSFDIGRIFTSNLNNTPYSLFRGNVTAGVGVSYATQYKGVKKALEANVKKLNDVLNELP